jgi:hypothetical protein
MENSLWKTEDLSQDKIGRRGGGGGGYYCGGEQVLEKAL